MAEDCEAPKPLVPDTSYRTFEDTFEAISELAHEHNLEAELLRQSLIQVAKILCLVLRTESVEQERGNDRPEFTTSAVRWMFCTMLWRKLFPNRPLPWKITAITEEHKERLRREYVDTNLLSYALNVRDPIQIARIINTAIRTGPADTPETDQNAQDAVPESVQDVGNRFLELVDNLQHAIIDLYRESANLPSPSTQASPSADRASIEKKSTSEETAKSKE
ncbi:hypothetical protein F4810DRAFT_711573 [Camillea tinctor]|nr:hypothetical protein F4810DRAFT_711573 [Camillea tinctor]